MVETFACGLFFCSISFSFKFPMEFLFNNHTTSPRSMRMVNEALPRLCVPCVHNRKLKDLLRNFDFVTRYSLIGLQAYSYESSPTFILVMFLRQTFLLVLQVLSTFRDAFLTFRGLSGEEMVRSLFHQELSSPHLRLPFHLALLLLF